MCARRARVLLLLAARCSRGQSIMQQVRRAYLVLDRCVGAVLAQELNRLAETIPGGLVECSVAELFGVAAVLIRAERLIFE